jgi:hypothetical protein
MDSRLSPATMPWSIVFGYENGYGLRDPERRAVDEDRPFTRQAKIELGRLVSMNIEGSMWREVGNSESDLVRRRSIAGNQSSPSQFTRLHVASPSKGVCPILTEKGRTASSPPSIPELCSSRFIGSFSIASQLKMSVQLHDPNAALVLCRFQ